MFPSSGYFRVLPCPFHPQGDCSRPYCHFKHAKPKKNLSRLGIHSRDSANKKLPPFLQKNGLKNSPDSRQMDTLPDIFEPSDNGKTVPVPEPSTPHLNTSSSPTAPSYSPLPSNLDASTNEKDEQIFPELGEACEETFTLIDDPKSTATPPNETIPPAAVQNDLETDARIAEEILAAVTDAEMLSSVEDKTTGSRTEEETTLLLPDIIAKLQAPLAPVKRHSDSAYSQNSHTELSPGIKRKRLSLTAEKRPNVLVITKKSSRLKSNLTVIDRDSIYMPKSAKSDPNVHSTPQINNKPSLPLTMESKVPVKMRQKFLDKVFEEYVKVLPENDSHSKAKEDEKKIYERTTNKQTYTYLCVSALRKVKSRVAKALGTTKSNGLEESNFANKVKKTAERTTLMPQNHFVKIPSKSSITSMDTDSPCSTPTTPVICSDMIKDLKTFDTLEEINKPKLAAVQAKTSGSELPALLEKYFLTEEQLIENGYPIRTSMSGVAELKVTPSSTEPQAINPDAKRHFCSRCGKGFIIMNNGNYMRSEECWYHYGKVFSQKVDGEWTAVFSCCKSSSFNGCQVADRHVTNGEQLSKRTGYILLQQAPERKENGIFALDCEMVYTSIGMELARVSVIDKDHKCVYDSYVKPSNQVIDYNTRFSGITEEKLSSNLPNLKQVQRDLKQILFLDSILIGHSLESDLKALKIIHNRVVDTAIVFPHRKGAPFKRALATLVREYLEKIIQEDDGGHDSTEDAIACMELMELQVSQDRAKLGKGRT